MNKLLIMLMAAGTATSSAQTVQHNHADSLLSRWVIDVNLLGGLASQTYTVANSTGNYLNALNANTGELKYQNGYSLGADAQLGFFFGKKRHFGIGTGVMLMQQKGDATLTNYHMEYQSVDGNGDIFRQVVNGNQIKENITTQSISIPLVLKYKNRFSKHWGFAADAGALINLTTKNTYTTNASFDYEAIYKFTRSADGGVTSVYDNSPVPSNDDWTITRAEFLRNNPNGNVQEYFNTKRAMGYRVGEGVAPANTSGKTTSVSGSIGLLVQPSFNYFLSDNAALNFGVYYMLQPLKNNAQAGYKLTDGPGNYSSVQNNVTASTNQSYGINIGARFFLGRKDRDHDGTADKYDYCPTVFGLSKFHGCPDTDGDGIPDKEDSCVTTKGLLLYYGCPDTDGDGIPDREDACPLVKGPLALHGCPDRDGDGIADKDDRCPDTYGIAALQGCPDKDGDGIADKDDKCPEVAGPASNQGCPIEPKKPITVTEETDISKPILFEVNKTEVQPSSNTPIDEAVEELKENKSATITIDGHADVTGDEAHNKVLSLERANAVKNQLVKRGINPKRLKTKGHGSSIPASDNSTINGRQQNRRAVMKISK